jgi:hypothetical protein
MSEDIEEFKAKFNNGYAIAQKKFNIVTFASDTLSIDEFDFILNFIDEIQPLANDTIVEPQMLKLIRDLKTKYLVKTRKELLQLLEDPSFCAGLRADFMLAFRRVLPTMDPITQDAIRGWTLPFSYKFEWFSPEFFLRWATTGNTAIFMGRLGSGKTDFAIYFYYLAQQLNILNEGKPDYLPFRLLTNVKLLKEVEEGYDPEEYMFSSFGEMSLKLVRNAMKGYHTLIIFDEAVAAGTSKKFAMHGKSIQMEQIGRLVRKFNGDFIRIYQFDTDVSTEDSNMGQLYVHKFGGTNDKGGRKRAQLTFKEGDRKNNFFISGIPTSPIKFDTKWTASFDSEDITFSEINTKFSEFQKTSKNTMEIWQQVEDWMTKRLKENTVILTDEEIDKLTKFLKELDWSLKDILQNTHIAASELTHRDMEDIMDQYKADSDGVTKRIIERHKTKEPILPTPSGDEWENEYEIKSY